MRGINGAIASTSWMLSDTAALAPKALTDTDTDTDNGTRQRRAHGHGPPPQAVHLSRTPARSRRRRGVHGHLSLTNRPGDGT